MSSAELFGMSAHAPVGVVRRVEPIICDATNCEMNVQLGIFFDGTGNNATQDESKMALTNIVRLHDAYISDKNRGVARIYIEGLGTAFPDIDEHDESTFGGAFGCGGEGRLLVAICSVFNNIYTFVLRQKWADREAVQAICRPRSFFRSDARLLEKFGLSESLNGSELDAKLKFFRRQISTLQEKIKEQGHPVTKEIIFDIFGFSRGAATARVFCHWVKKISQGGKIAGIPIRFRFLGLMDTVASVGVWDGIKSTLFNRTGGHTDWAIAQHMLILPEVENCIHMVAMHEIRKNFPLDQVAVGDAMPENCHEFAYPGSHSDVGGGYAPGALGIASGHSLQETDSRKLSQVPLNHMFECAMAAGVPMSKDIASRNSVALFEISPAVEEAFQKLVRLSPSGKQRLSDWMLPYLIWRWRTRLEYRSLRHVRNANEEDLGYLMEAHTAFMEDASKVDSDYQQTEPTALDNDAWEVRRRVLAAKPNPADLDDFFDKFVHDSLAGFRKKLTEPTGHWRCRRTFRGDERALLT